MINTPDFLHLLLHLGFNFITLLVLVRFIYYQATRRKDFLLTYFLVGTIVFLLCYLLENVSLGLGFALGLFAIFGILRYRTTTIPVKEMTYLFLIIGISVINSLSTNHISIAELLFANLVVMGLSFGLEKIWLLKHESAKTIVYEKIDLIKPARREELIEDLESRVGIKINRVEIGRVNFLRDTARIKIYYYTDEHGTNNADEEEGRYPALDDEG